MTRKQALVLASAIAASSGPAGRTAYAALDEVVVTAQRRAEALQQVPISAAVLGEAQLERAQIANLEDLQYVAPNLTNVPVNVTRSALSFNIRGLYARDAVPTVDPTVGVYLDEVYLGRMLGTNLRTLDLERVEVLRGPQGTLFGRNAIGGAVSLISRKPSTQREGVVRLSLGNVEQRQLESTVNLPWNGTRQALRASAALSDRDGFAHAPNGAALDDERSRFGRLQYRHSAPAGWNMNLSLDYTGIDSGSQRRTLLAIDPSASGLPAEFGNPGDDLSRYVDPYAREVPVNVTGDVTTRTWGAAAVLTAPLAQFDVKSISSYRQMESGAQNADLDATPYDLAHHRYRFDDQHQISQELQVLGATLADRLDWISGLYYFEERGGFRQRVRTYLPGTSTWNETSPSGKARNRAAALYAQVEYSPAPRWTLTAGARYNIDGRQLTSYNGIVINDVPSCRLSVTARDDPEQCRATLPERRFEYVPWTAGVAFQRSVDSLYYLKLSRGFHAGGYNIRGVGLQDLATFEPERATAWEIGAKSDWSQRRLRLNVALFHIAFDAIQVTERDRAPTGFPGAAVIRNGGAARIIGGEFEGTALLPHATVSAAVAVTRPAFTRLSPGVQEIALDSHFLHTPEWSATVSLDVPLQLSSVALQLHADYGWRDDAWFDYEPQTRARQRAYGLLNLRLAVRFKRDAPELWFWARNATDHHYLVKAFREGYFSSAIPGEPRTIGLTLSYRFPRD